MPPSPPPWIRACNLYILQVKVGYIIKSMVSLVWSHDVVWYHFTEMAGDVRETLIQLRIELVDLHSSTPWCPCTNWSFCEGHTTPFFLLSINRPWTFIHFLQLVKCDEVLSLSGGFTPSRHLRPSNEVRAINCGLIKRPLNVQASGSTLNRLSVLPDWVIEGVRMSNRIDLC